MTLHFIKNVLQIDVSSYYKKDGIFVIKLLITMLENIDCADTMPSVLTILLVEIKRSEKYPSPAFITKVFEAISMCFFNNAELSLELLAS